jgi:HEAT repeat protein
MKKRLGIGLGILLSIALIAVLAIPESRLTILGYLRGENRFQGRPTSYWRFKVESYASYSVTPAATRTSYWDKLLKLLSITNSHSRPDKPALLEGKSEALPVLIDLIREKRSLPVTQEAYNALGAMGRPIAKDALPFLEEEINGQDLHFRIVAVRTLGRFGPDGIPPLIKALKHDSPQVRSSAAYTLQEIGHGPKGSVPRDAVLALVEALNDEVADVRTWAAHALVTIDPDEADKAHAERSLPKIAIRILPDSAMFRRIFAP